MHMHLLQSIVMIEVGIKIGLCNNRKTYISITIDNKSYFISINDNVLIMRLCQTMVFQLQIIMVILWKVHM